MYPENETVVALLGALQGQWTVGPTGRYIGVPLDRVELALKWSGIEMTPELFEDWRFLSSLYVKSINKLADAASGAGSDYI